jgi:VWFA-related protein
MQRGTFMRRILISAFLLFLALPSWAAKRITVAQLEQILVSDTAAHKSDPEIARKISDIDLSERLTEQTLARLSNPFPNGSQAAMALLLLADRSAFLDPPPAELPSAPAPDTAAQQRLLAAAQKFAVDTLPHLPNLLATRTTFSFDDSPQEITKGAYLQRAGMHLLGSSKAEISVRNERENPSASATPQVRGGLMTWGEFGSALLILLSDSAQGKTTWSHWEQTSSGLLAVFHYEVPKAASHYEIDTPVEQTQYDGSSSRWAVRGGMVGMTSSSATHMLHARPAYQGSLWIDPMTGAILRMSLMADLKGNPSFERGAVLVEYGPVQIADKTLICPVRSLALSSAPPTVATTFAGTATQWLNENLFTNYHIFASTTRILSETASAPTTTTPDAGQSPPQPAPAVPPLAPQPASPMSGTSSPAPAETEAASQPNTPAPASAILSTPTADAAPSTPPPSASAAPPTPTASAEQPASPANIPTSPTSPSAQLAPPSASGMTLRVNVEELLVPVVVRDRDGHAIGTLTKADFTVLDQGKPRPITGFSIVKSTALQETPQSGQPRTSSETAAPAATQNRFTVFLFDDRHLNPSDLVRTQQAALRALNQTFAPNDYAAVVSFMGVNSGITHDRAALKAAVTHITVHHEFQRDNHDCPDISYYSADKILNQHDDNEFAIAVAKVKSCSQMQAMDPAGSNTGAIENPQTPSQRLAVQAATRALAIGQEDARQSLLSVGTVVRAMSKLSGQRTLILVSPGFLSLSPEMMTFKSQLFDQALAANVIINALDARGLYAGNIDASEGPNATIGLSPQDQLNASQESANAMSELANGTGGTFFQNNNDLEAGFKTLMAQPEYLYLLEISLKDVKQTGSYHSLKVTTDQPGLSVQARRGYFAPRETRARQ